MGGAIFNQGSLTGTYTFIGNSATTGGALCNYVDATLNNTNFQDNTATTGGAVYNASGVTLTETGNTYNGNVSHCGGAIFNQGTINETSTTFQNNQSTGGYGGAVLNDVDAIFTGYKNTFLNNTASYGGGVYNQGNIALNFCRIIANTGIDIYNNAGTVNAENNWWGANFQGTNPGDNGKINSNVSAWIVLTLSATTPVNGSSTITADLLHDNNGATVNDRVPYTGLVTFTSTLGTINSTTMSDGQAVTILTVSGSGTATVTAKVDNAAVNKTVTF